MTYRFSLADDDQDLTAPLLDDPTFTAASQLSRGTTGMQTQRSGPQALQQQQPWTPDVQRARDPALDQQWQDAERQSLTRYQQGGNGYSGAGEYAGAGVAGAFDLLANAAGGRAPKDFRPGHEYMPPSGLPSLMSGTQQLVDRNRAQQEQESQKAGEFALKARAQKDSAYSDALKLKQIQQQEERIGLATQGEGRRTATSDRQLNPDNPALVAAKQELVRQAGGRITLDQLANVDEKGMLDIRHGLNLQIDSANTPQKAADEGTIATARGLGSQTGTNQANVRDLPSLRVAAGRGDAAAEDITRPGKVLTSGQTAEAGAQGREVVEGPIRNAQQDQTFATEFANKHGNALKAAQALGELLDSKQPGQDIEGLSPHEVFANQKMGGLLGGLTSEKAQATNQKLTTALIAIGHEDSGAALNTRELAEEAVKLMGSSSASAADREAAIRRTYESLNQDIQGAAAPRPQAAKRVLDARGMGSKRPAKSGSNDWSQYEVK